MIGINTASVIALVADEHPMRNGAMQVLPENAGSKMAFTKKPNGTIATSNFPSSPVPARIGLVNVSPEAHPERLSSAGIDKLGVDASGIHVSSAGSAMLSIDELASKKQMCRVDAAGGVASVANDGVGGNRSIGDNPRQPVRSNGSPRLRKIEKSITTPVGSGCPKPALTIGLFVNFSPESGQDFRFGKHRETMTN